MGWPHKIVRHVATVATVTALLTASVLVPTCPADVITLTNGNTIEGQIVQETSRLCVIETLGGRLTIPVDRVQTITRGDPWTLYLQRADAAVSRGLWSEAVSDYRIAIELLRGADGGADPAVMARVEAAIEDCASQMESQSMVVFAEVLEQVDALEEAGNQEQALELIDTAIAEAVAGLPTEVLETRAARVLLSLAHRQRDMVQQTQAIASLRQALERDPELNEARILLGQMLAARNPLDPQTVEVLQQAIEHFDDDTNPSTMVDTHLRLAQCLERQGHLLEASDAYEVVAERGGREHPRALGWAVDCHVEWAQQTPNTAENGEHLLEVLNHAVTLNPQSTAALNLLGDVHLRAGRVIEAIRVLSTSLEIQHSQPLIHLKLAGIYQDQGNLDLAFRHLRFAVQYDPNLYIARCQLAEVYEARGQFSLALEELARAREIGDRFARAYFVQGRIHYKQGELDVAQGDFEAAIQRSGSTIDPRLFLARIFTEEADLVAARQQYEQVLVLTESDTWDDSLDRDEVRAQCQVGLGRIHLIGNHNHQARQCFDLALELDPESADAYAALGEVTARMGEFRQAEQHYRRAIELDPDEPNHYFNLGLLYQEHLRQNDLAVECYRQYVAHRGTDLATVQSLLNALGATLD